MEPITHDERQRAYHKAECCLNELYYLKVIDDREYKELIFHCFDLFLYDIPNLREERNE